MTFPIPGVLDFGDVSAEMCQWLRSHPLLAGVVVSGDLMEYEAGVVSLSVFRDGGRIEGVWDDAVLGCEVRAHDSDEGMRVAQIARSLMLSSPRELPSVVRASEVVGLVRFDDPVSLFAAFRWSVAVTRRGVEV